MSKIVYFLYSLSRFFYLSNIPFLPGFIKTVLIRLIFSANIPYTASIGKNTVFAYGGLGIVIHSRAVIGKNCLIGTNVTIGGTSRKKEVPVLGDNVYVGSGAKILGPITIASNVVIGANAVVIANVPENSIVAGIPARIIRQNIDIKQYHEL